MTGTMVISRGPRKETRVKPGNVIRVTRLSLGVRPVNLEM